MKLVKLKSLFEIIYPKTMVLASQLIDAKGVNFVSTKGSDNGISEKIKETDEYIKYLKGAITVALKGSVMSAFVQFEDFYPAHQVAILYPKIEIGLNVKVYYCLCIKFNQYKYNYGRQADKTLAEILLPDISKIPNWVNEIKVDKPKLAPLNKVKDLSLYINRWKLFELTSLFKITGSKTTSIRKIKKYGVGKFPYVTTRATNNGTSGLYDFYTEEGNVLTIDSAVTGYCSYQPTCFSASDHVEKLIPKFNINKYTAIFLVTILNLERYKYNYGRKASQIRIKKTLIKLPVDNKDNPDWQFMENYIKSLAYSSNI